jgi:Flp pilus assembly protein TadG
MSTRYGLTRRLLAPVIHRGRGLARDEHGAVAVEFGILAVPFFALIFAIIETSMAFFAQQVLESALQDATRSVRTGQSDVAGWTEQTFREEICSRTFGLFECSETNATTDRLRVKVSPVTTFQTAATQIANPIDAECATDVTKCTWTLVEAYDDGKGSDVIIAQAFYKWPMMIDLPWFSLATQAGGDRLLSAVRVFKNEPF